MGKKNTQTFRCPFCEAVAYKPSEFERHVFMKHGKHVKAERHRQRSTQPNSVTTMTDAEVAAVLIQAGDMATHDMVA